jgi:hypothetical protein
LFDFVAVQMFGAKGQELRQEAVCREGTDEEDVSDYPFFFPFVTVSEFDRINCSDVALNLRAANV